MLIAIFSLFCSFMSKPNYSVNCSEYFIFKDTASKVKIVDSLKKSTDNKDSSKNQDKKSLLKPYKEIITTKAISKKGLFTVHWVDDKYYFEIKDSMLNQEFLAITRFVKVPGGAFRYGGEEVNTQTLKFVKGPANKVFLKQVTLINYADSTQIISQAVTNSNLDPIVASFDLKTISPDSSWIIDVTDFFKGDNQVISLTKWDKSIFNLSSIIGDRSYIDFIHTYPINTEIKTIKTYNAITPQPFSPVPSRFPIVPAAENAGVLTFELNTSFIQLPKIPMEKRLFDSRVGYFADEYILFSDDQQKVKTQTFAVRYRLEPKPEDRAKYFKGELVEPQKPIVYYIDPATPKQWVKYLIQGINDWNIAFEKAGFKNAIIGKEWPVEDSTMSLEDARFSVLRYFASNIQNAYGPQVHDPRTGEIIESHIGWYHNVMQLLHHWYFIQTAAVDSGARKMKFDDELMGQLIRFVSSHEVGHTLGLRHNMGSSSTTPVEKLRDKNWVEANGHTASIMDYARFNYVAQPEDNISRIGLFPRIGEYDKWAIEWGYKYTGIQNPDSDYLYMNPLVIKVLNSNPRLWFGGEGWNNDPRAQTEDLSDNSIKASEYGIKNLKRVVNHLETWTKEEGDKYNNLNDMFLQVTYQFQRYMGHVIKNIGGVYETFKSVEQAGDVYEPTPKSIQQSAMKFLNKNIFETPLWLLPKNILNKTSQPNGLERIQQIQQYVINSLNDPTRLYRLLSTADRFGENSVYTLSQMLSDERQFVFAEMYNNSLKSDIYRRNLQKYLLDKWLALIDKVDKVNNVRINSTLAINIDNTDIPSEIKAQLRTLVSQITSVLPQTTSTVYKNHLLDIKDRIQKALDPRK